MVADTGFEPVTYRLWACRATAAPIRYNVRLVWACHQEAAEICYLGFAESATTDFLRAVTAIGFRLLKSNMPIVVNADLTLRHRFSNFTVIPLGFNSIIKPIPPFSLLDAAPVAGAEFNFRHKLFLADTGCLMSLALHD